MSGLNYPRTGCPRLMTMFFPEKYIVDVYRLVGFILGIIVGYTMAKRVRYTMAKSVWYTTAKSVWYTMAKRWVPTCKRIRSIIVCWVGLWQINTLKLEERCIIFSFPFTLPWLLAEFPVVNLYSLTKSVSQFLLITTTFQQLGPHHIVLRC